MKFCDITISYNEKSGGIRTYIDEKRRYLLENTDHEHVLIVPDDHDHYEHDEAGSIYYVSSPTIPGHAPYRSFWRPGPIAKIFEEVQPDVIELGSFYVSPWPTFQFRNHQQKLGKNICVGGYFHTDVARVLVSGPLEHSVSSVVGDWSPLLEKIGYEITHALASGVESYIRSVFEHCDARFAASQQQAERLEEYGVDHVQVVPLGVDLEQFRPDRRSQEVRDRFQASPDDVILIYGGRLNEEKDAMLLLKAYKSLPDDSTTHLVILGEGPLRDDLEEGSQNLPRVHLLDYESDMDRYAALLASADIYVTAGPYETFGLSVAEAQAAGLPVVGVHSGALTERVNDEIGRLVKPHDAKAFAQAIVEVSEQREAMRERAHQYAQANYSWQKTFDQLVGFYESKFPTRRY